MSSWGSPSWIRQVYGEETVITPPGNKVLRCIKSLGDIMKPRDGIWKSYSSLTLRLPGLTSWIQELRTDKEQRPWKEGPRGPSTVPKSSLRQPSYQWGWVEGTLDSQLGTKEAGTHPPWSPCHCCAQVLTAQIHFILECWNVNILSWVNYYLSVSVSPSFRTPLGIFK